MKKSWLVIAAAIPLAVIVSVAAWKLSGDDSRRQGALGTNEAVALSWRGDWSEKAEYVAGNVVTHDGASYVAEGEKLSQAPRAACTECGWTLLALESASEEEKQVAPPPTEQEIHTAVSTQRLELTPAETTFTVIPGVTLTVDVAADHLVYVHTDGAIDNAGLANLGAGSASTNLWTRAEIAVFVDGSRTSPLDAADVLCTYGKTRGGHCNWSRGQHIRPIYVPAGTHTFDLRIRHVGGDDVITGGIRPNWPTGADLDVILMKKS